MSPSSQDLATSFPVVKGNQVQLIRLQQRPYLGSDLKTDFLNANTLIGVDGAIGERRAWARVMQGLDGSIPSIELVFDPHCLTLEDGSFGLALAIALRRAQYGFDSSQPALVASATLDLGGTVGALEHERLNDKLDQLVAQQFTGVLLLAAAQQQLLNSDGQCLLVELEQFGTKVEWVDRLEALAGRYWHRPQAPSGDSTGDAPTPNPSNTPQTKEHHPMSITTLTLTGALVGAGWMIADLDYRPLTELWQSEPLARIATPALAPATRPPTEFQRPEAAISQPDQVVPTSPPPPPKAATPLAPRPEPAATRPAPIAPATLAAVVAPQTEPPAPTAPRISAAPPRPRSITQCVSATNSPELDQNDARLLARAAWGADHQPSQLSDQRKMQVDSQGRQSVITLEEEGRYRFNGEIDTSEPYLTDDGRWCVTVSARG